MRAKLLGAVLAALCAPVALAGELPKQGHILPATPAAADDQPQRSNFYAGIVGGYGLSNVQVEGLDFADGKLIGGAMVGWNYRLSQGFMLGLEADWIFTGIAASTEVDELTIRASTDHLVSVRGRAGTYIGPVLLYGTLGPAWEHSRLQIGDISDRTWQLGLAAGGGAEIDLTKTIAVRLEAIHFMFPNGGPFNTILDSDNQQTTVRAGIAFKLN